MLLKVLILFLVSFDGINCILHSFPIQYIGNSMSVAEYKNTNICETRICMKDAKRLIAHASLRNDTDPCVDFAEFACGHFFEFRASNDRHSDIGFINELERQHQHRLKRILRQKIDKEEPKIFQIIKSFFQKCVNSSYVRNEGRAEIFGLLAEFGKFPLLDDNWKPTDFNLTKAQIAFEDGIFSSKKNHFPRFKSIMVQDMLHFDLGFSHNETSEILNDFGKIVDDDFKKVLLSYWIDFNSTRDCDLHIRRKLANSFMIIFLMKNVAFFSVYPRQWFNKRSLNRYEMCIEQVHHVLRFPFEIMFQLNHEKQIDKLAFQEFYRKALLLQFEVAVDDLFMISNETLIEEMKESIMNISIHIGYPDELTNTKFLNNIYASLNLTGQEGPHKIYHELKGYKDIIKDDNILTENGKDIFNKCKILIDFCFDVNDFIVFRTNDLMYPIYHPDRPYFVNLTYLYYQIYKIVDEKMKKYLKEQNLPYEDVNREFEGPNDLSKQHHYSKYVEQFGPDLNLPGFLMTNKQMMEFINFQTKCVKWQDGQIDSYYKPLRSFFNC